VSVGYLIFDDWVVLGASIERAIHRLNALTSETPDRLQPFCPHPRMTDHRVLMTRQSHELEGSEESLPIGLVAKSRNGDAAAMEFLIEHYQPRIAGFVFALLGDGQAVEDLCQTIFYKMLLGLPRLEDDEKFEPWLFRIARNACFDYLRRRRLRRIFLPWKSGDDQFASAAEPMPESDNDRRIVAFRRALMMLPKKQRELVALLQDDRLSYEQLAAITDSNVTSVKSRLFRARRQLRKWMHDDH
jgi:RNA polymerase sigma-70 factor (ECF subfamily)